MRFISVQICWPKSFWKKLALCWSLSIHGKFHNQQGLLLGLSCHISTRKDVHSSVSSVPSIFMEMHLRSIFVILKSTQQFSLLRGKNKSSETPVEPQTNGHCTHHLTTAPNVEFRRPLNKTNDVIDSTEIKLKCGLWFLLSRFNRFPFNNNQDFY